jgi:hypothetical protein
MLIENVSGGGNRLDYALLAYTDVGWMDDRTAPSDHVRHNFEGLALAFPPAYLLSFVIDSEVEPLVGAADFGNIARSRMPGILGVTYRYQQVEIDADLLGALRLGIEQYKSFRHITSEAYALLLTQQAPVGAGWDVVEEITEDRRTALIFAFKGTADPGSLLVHPRRLNAEATYDVRSLDAGHFGRFTGSQLMSDGLVINHGSGSRAHLIFVTQISD